MTLNVINGLPTKMKYGFMSFSDIDHVSQDVKDYYSSTGYSKPRYNMNAGFFQTEIDGNLLEISDYDGTEEQKYMEVGVNVFPDTVEGKCTDLAGTIYVSTIKISGLDVEDSYINVAYVIESTTSPVTSRVDVKLKHDNPLMQSIVDCNGTVHDFKKGVTLSDFSKYISSTTDPEYNEIVNLDGLTPTNISEESSKAGKVEAIKPDIRYRPQNTTCTDYKCDAVVDTIICSWCRKEIEGVGYSLPIETVIRSYGEFAPFMIDSIGRNAKPLCYYNNNLYPSTYDTVSDSVLSIQIQRTFASIVNSKKYILKDVYQSN